MSRMWIYLPERYPYQWVGLSDVEWDKPGGVNVVSAVVKYADKTEDELLDMQISGQDIITEYTTPQNFPYGQVLIWGCGDE